MSNNRDKSEIENYPASPVPDDDLLLIGELPFTAFGQHGINRFDKRVFEQDIYWVDYFGKEHSLDKMEKSYLENVVKYLIEGANIFYLGAVERYTATKLADSILGRVNRDAVAEQFNIPSIDKLDPIVWLESTPLYRKLQSNIKKMI